MPVSIACSKSSIDRTTPVTNTNRRSRNTLKFTKTPARHTRPAGVYDSCRPIVASLHPSSLEPHGLGALVADRSGGSRTRAD
jgi:hypothetical protein